MTVRDDLIAARALIDTPEKFAAIGNDPSALFEALHDVCPTEARFWSARETLLAVSNVRTLGSTANWPHADIMALFDRAIAAQEQP